MNQVNIGIIGTSWWAEAAFLPVMQSYERANPVAICGRNRARAREMANNFDIAEVYTDYREMIAQANLHAVIVATPDDLHYEMVMAALDAGLHVLCEKPVAMNADQVLEMLNKAEEIGVKHMVMYTWYWFPAFQEARQRIDEGFIGKIYHAGFKWQFDFGRSNQYLWRMDKRRSNGNLADLGSHLIHLALWYLGDIVTVTARLGFFVERQGIDDQPLVPANDGVFLILEFASGAIAYLTTTVVANILRSDWGMSIDIHGSGGSLAIGYKYEGDKWEQMFNATSDNAEDEKYEVDQVDWVEYLKKKPAGARYFIDCILDDKPVSPSLADGYKVQRVIDAALESHETGKRIEILT